jgi:hypothetical protein
MRSRGCRRRSRGAAVDGKRARSRAQPVVHEGHRAGRGISGRAQHSIGSLITTDANGSLLTTINQVTPVWVRFSLAPTDLAKIPNGASRVPRPRT